MLILDQSKTNLLNLDHIVRLSADGQSVYAKEARAKTEDEITLGVYSTKQRAGEVLMAIAKTYGRYISVQGGPLFTREGYVQPMAFEPPKVYTMPEE